MKITFARKKGVRVLGVKGKLRAPNWPVLDKHFDALLANGNSVVALDLSEASLICDTGVGTIMHNVRKFRERGAALMVVAAMESLHEDCGLCRCEAERGGFLFPDWESLERQMLSSDPMTAA